MILRTWGESDLKQIAEIEQASFSDPWTLEAFLPVLRFPVLHGILAEEGGQVLGYACTQVVCEEMELQNIAVAPWARGKGVGTALLAAAEENAKSRGAQYGFLEARVSNFPALSLYEKFGYQKIGVRKNYYPDGEAAVVMKKDL